MEGWLLKVSFIKYEIIALYVVEDYKLLVTVNKDII